MQGDREKYAKCATRFFLQCMNYAPELLGVGRYTGQLARYLADQGEAVEVVTAVPHYPGWTAQNRFKAWRYYRDYIDGVTVTRCPIFLHKSGRGVWRLLAPLTFAITAAPVVFWRILRGRPDVVICVMPTLLAAPVAVLAAKIIGARSVIYVQDLEVDAAFNVGHLKGAFLKSVAVQFERFLLARFSTVVTISVRMIERLVAKGVRRERVAMVRNWVDTTQIRPLVGKNPFRDQLGVGEQDFVVLYAGQIGPKQALHHLLAAAESCSDEKKIHFVVAGDGLIKSVLQEKYRCLKSVKFLPPQPEELLCELLNCADLHVICQDSNAADLVLPSKLAGILASGRPLLVTAEQGTELHDLLDGKAIIVPPNSPVNLAETIRTAEKERPKAPVEAMALVQEFSSATVLPRFRRILSTDSD